MSNPANYPIFILSNQTIRQKWCVYAHSPRIEHGGLECRYIGYCYLSEIMTPPDCVRNSMWLTHVQPYEYETRVVFIGNKQECMIEASRLRNMHRTVCNVHGHMASRGQRVRCITTGQEFENAAEAAKVLGFTKGTLSNHLNGRPEYETIRGLRFERIM